MRIVQDPSELRAILSAHAGTIGFAPTMGYLHEGHMTLFRRAAAENTLSVVSIFVNPTQFGPNEDFAAYPRDAAGDIARTESCGVDVLWMPTVEHMYPTGHATTVTVSGVTKHLCGASRPVHFAGVATVVAKLFNVVRPTRAYFGQKDFQQLAVIRRMNADLDFGIEVIGVPTVREADGLAMSSRNAYLSLAERPRALKLSEALRLAGGLWGAGFGTVSDVRDRMLDVLRADDAVRVDYVEICDPSTLEPLDGALGSGSVPAVALIAGFVGRTRLIDNAVLG